VLCSVEAWRRKKSSLWKKKSGRPEDQRKKSSELGSNPRGKIQSLQEAALQVMRGKEKGLSIKLNKESLLRKEKKSRDPFVRGEEKERDLHRDQEHRGEGPLRSRWTGSKPTKS